MFGFSKKKEKDNEASRLERPEGGAEPGAKPPKVPLKLREDGASALNPAEQPRPAAETPDQGKAPPIKKPKLRLMTGQEERERAFLAAREHFLSKSLPEIQKEAVRKERSKTFDVVMEKLVAVAGLFLLSLFVFWLYNNAEIINNWWQNLIEGFKFI
jgi:hypothetical protein